MAKTVLNVDIYLDKIVSVNEQYFIAPIYKRVATASGWDRRIVGFRKVLSSICEQERNAIWRALEHRRVPRGSFNPLCFYELRISFIMKKGFYSRDVDNGLKFAIDCFFKYLKLNDRRILRLATQKGLGVGYPREMIHFHLIELERADLRGLIHR